MNLQDVPVLIYLSHLLMWVLVIGQGLVLLGLVAYLAKLETRLAARMAGAAPVEGDEAPEFSALDLSGNRVSTETIRGRFTGLLFVSPQCPTCMTTLAELHYLTHKALGNLVVVCRGAEEDCSMLATRYELSVPTVVDEIDWLGRLFGITGTPSAVLIDERNRIVSRGQPGRGEQLQTFFEPPAADDAHSPSGGSAATAGS